MSRDIFASTQQTPLPKAPRTPSMTPTRSVKRRSCVERRYNNPPPITESKREERSSLSVLGPLKACSSQPVLCEDFYDLRTRHVPLSSSFSSLNDREIWEQYGIYTSSRPDGQRYMVETETETDNSHRPRQEDVRRKREDKNERLGLLWKFFSSLGMVLMMVLSAFVGAFVYAYFHKHVLNSGNFLCPPQIAHDVQLERPVDETIHSLQLENSLIREEVKNLKDHISQIQENVGSEVIPRPQKGILEELLTADLACAGNLGSVLATPGTTTVTVPVTVTLLWILSFNVEMNHRTPQTTLEGLIQEVGDCWPFEGSRGRLVVKLHRRSVVAAVSLSHIPPSVSVTGDVGSAPRLFQVLAHQHEHDLENGRILGEFEYKSPGTWRQTFYLEPSNTKEDPIDIIEFRFLENHGHPNYTCVYRVHVHGKTL